MSVPDPITREETYLAAIAGDDVEVPSPVTRPEDFLKAIDDHIGDVEEDVDDLETAVTALQAVVPTPAAADSGKVLTAGADGTGSWQEASGGGGGNPVVIVTDDSYTLPDGETLESLKKRAVDIYYKYGNYAPEYNCTTPIIYGNVFGNNAYYAFYDKTDIIVNSASSASVGKQLTVYVFGASNALTTYWYGQDSSGYTSLSDNPN